MSKTNKIIPIFVSHKGCPNDCIFCNQKKITGTSGDEVDGEYVKKTIEYYLETSSRYSDLAFFGGSFTAIDTKLQKELLEVAFFYKKKRYFDNIRISTRPDAINIEILNMQRKYGVDIIELGIQSLDDEVLIKAGRGHTAKDSKNASELIKQYGFILGHQIMPGLPGSSFKKDVETCYKSIEMKPNIARIYPTLVIKDTELEILYKENQYMPLPFEKAIELSAYIYSLYTVNNIEVIRIGLQSTDKVNDNNDVIAGPFHPAFRQLVEEKLYQNTIINSILSSQPKEKSFEKVKIWTDNKTMNYVVGQRKKNLEIIKRICKIDEILLEEASEKNCVKIYNGDKLIKEIRSNDIFNQFIYAKCLQ